MTTPVTTTRSSHRTQCTKRHWWEINTLTSVGTRARYYSTYCPLHTCTTWQTHAMCTVNHLTPRKANHALTPYDTQWGPYLVQVACRSPQSCNKLWQHVVARTVEFSLQPFSLVLCQLNLHTWWRKKFMQVLHSHETQGSSAHACATSLSILPLAPPQSTSYLCPACSQSHLARLGKLLAQCSQVNRTAWTSQTVFEDRTYDSTTATNI